MINNTNDIAMDLTLDGTNESLQLQGSLENGFSLFIGNEYNHNHTSVFLENISQLESNELIEKLTEINKVLQEAVREVKQLAVEAYQREPMIEGALDEIEETEGVD